MTPIFDAGLRVSSFRALLVTVVLLSVPMVAFGTVPGAPVVPVSAVSASADSAVPATVAPGPVSTDVLELAFSAASCAVRAGSVQSPATLTVIDYSKPSTEKRLWVFDMRTRAVLYEEMVAHGMGSGDHLAISISTAPAR